MAWRHDAARRRAGRERQHQCHGVPGRAPQRLRCRAEAGCTGWISRLRPLSLPTLYPKFSWRAQLQSASHGSWPALARLVRPSFWSNHLRVTDRRLTGATRWRFMRRALHKRRRHNTCNMSWSQWRRRSRFPGLPSDNSLRDLPTGSPAPVAQAQGAQHTHKNTEVTNHFWFVTSVQRLERTAHCGRRGT